MHGARAEGSGQRRNGWGASGAGRTECTHVCAGFGASCTQLLTMGCACLCRVWERTSGFTLRRTEGWFECSLTLPMDYNTNPWRTTGNDRLQRDGGGWQLKRPRGQARLCRSIFVSAPATWHIFGISRGRARCFGNGKRWLLTVHSHYRVAACGLPPPTMPVSAAQKTAIEEVVRALTSATSRRVKRRLADMFMELVDKDSWPEYYEARLFPNCSENSGR